MSDLVGEQKRISTNHFKVVPIKANMNPRNKKKRSNKKKHSVKKRTSDGNIVPFLKCCNEGSEPSSSVKRMKRGHPLTEIGNHPERQAPTNTEKTIDEEREFTVNLGDSGKEHVVKGTIHDSLLSALKASKDVNAHMDKKKGKKMYLLGKKGIEGCINLGMPLKYVPSGSQFEMKFYISKQTKSSDELEYRQDEIKSKECVLFFVAPNANKFRTNEPLSDKIIRCNQLLKEHSNLCVFAPKEETIKDALCKDGRFTSLLKERDWVLMENKKSIPNNLTVDSLSNRTFTVHVKTEKRASSTKGPNNEHVLPVSQAAQLKALYSFKSNILNAYPDLENQSEIINTFFQNVRKQPKHKNDIFRVYKEAFCKKKNNSIPIKLENLHVNLSNSVGYIMWDKFLKKGTATCFVLCDKYILTCHHVVKFIVGEGVEEKDWARKISQSACVTFSYVDSHPNSDPGNWFELEEWFEISDMDLDFAVLKLKENVNKSSPPDGLVQFTFDLPCNGLIDIIGHPDGETKQTDGCSVINVYERPQELFHRVLQEQETQCNPIECGIDAYGTKCIHLYNPRDFPEIIDNHNTVTYDTSFFHGSSGSPVFDRNGRLLAMHAAGYLYRGKRKQKSIIEFGYSMMSILAAIEKKHKSWYDSEIGPFLQAGCDGDKNAVGAYPTDVEMQPVD
ncbi:serine protease FAM111A isoform X3 [Anolis carolinensis]